MMCPCKGCNKRWVSPTSRCHSHCEEYKNWRAFIQDVIDKKKIYRIKEINSNSVLYGKLRPKS